MTRTAPAFNAEFRNTWVQCYEDGSFVGVCDGSVRLAGIWKWNPLKDRVDLWSLADINDPAAQQLKDGYAFWVAGQLETP